MDGRLAALLKRRKILLDGGMGTELFKCGLQSGDAPELWAQHHSDAVIAIHRAFLDAGSDILLTNTFGANALRLKLHHAQDQVARVNCDAVHLAQRALKGSPALIAGSMGPTGELIEPLGALTFDGAVEAYRTQACALKEGGVDLLWIETLSAQEEVEAAVMGARSTGLPIVCTMTFDTAGKTMMGLAPEQAFQIITALDAPVIACGLNCGTGPREALIALRAMMSVNSDNFPTVIKANCGIPQFKDGAFSYSSSAESMADYARHADHLGATFIGGCCGTSPAILKSMHQALLDDSPYQPSPLESSEAAPPARTPRRNRRARS